MTPTNLELAIFQAESARKLLERAAKLNADADATDTLIAGQLGRSLADVDAALCFLRERRSPEVVRGIAERKGEVTINE